MRPQAAGPPFPSSSSVLKMPCYLPGAIKLSYFNSSRCGAGFPSPPNLVVAGPSVDASLDGAALGDLEGRPCFVVLFLKAAAQSLEASRSPLEYPFERPSRGRGTVLVSFQFFFSEQFWVLRKYRIGQCKRFRGRRRRRERPARRLFQQMVELDVQPEGRNVPASLRVLLECGHENLISSIVCKSMGFEGPR